MAEHKVEIKMSRFDNAPWGFRVHGGMDFGSPLTIQKVSKPTWVYLFFTCTYHRSVQSHWQTKNLHSISTTQLLKMDIRTT